MRRSVDPVIYCTASAMVHGLSLDATGGIQSRTAQVQAKRMMYVAESINAKELSRARQGSCHSALLCRPNWYTSCHTTQRGAPALPRASVATSCASCCSSVRKSAAAAELAPRRPTASSAASSTVAGTSVSEVGSSRGFRARRRVSVLISTLWLALPFMRAPFGSCCCSEAAAATLAHTCRHFTTLCDAKAREQIKKVPAKSFYRHEESPAQQLQAIECTFKGIVRCCTGSQGRPCSLILMA